MKRWRGDCPSPVRDQLARERAAVLRKQKGLRENRSAEDVRLAARRAARSQAGIDARRGHVAQRPNYVTREPAVPPPLPVEFSPRPVQQAAPTRRVAQAQRVAAPPAPSARRPATARPMATTPDRPPAAPAIATAGSTASIEASAAAVLARGLVSRTAHVTTANADNMLVRLQSREALRAQILIAELLAPPVALRE